MKIANNVTELTGNTPLVRLTSISKDTGTTALGKCEFLNPTYSIKDRIGDSMIQDAIKSGKITQNTKIIEPTSGNTGIALASTCASLGLQLTLVMPSSMSAERKRLLAALGANLILTGPELGMRGAVQKAVELQQADPSNSYILQQFENLANPKTHEMTTAERDIR